MSDRRDFIKFMALLSTQALVNWSVPADAKIKKAPKGEFDAIIVGAGLGGLSCAALLANSGLRPLVIEKHDVVGGYATSFVRQAENGDTFTCEVSLHSIAAKSPSAQKMLMELGVWDKLELVPYKMAKSLHYPDTVHELPPYGLDTLKKLLSEKFPEQKDGLEKFFTFWKKFAQETEEFSEKGMPFLKLAFPMYYPSMWEVRNRTLGQVLDKYISDARLKALLSPYWGYYGLPPSQLSAFYYLLPTAQYFNTGGYYIRGTSQKLSNLLAEVIKKGGGEIHTSDAVREIILENGMAAGVKTSSGKKFKGGAVIVNASAKSLVGRLVPESSFPSDYRERINACKPSIGSFIVWLGVNGKLSDIQPRPEITLVPGYDPEAAYRGALAGDPEKAGITCLIYDNISPGYSPRGRSSLTIMFLCGYEPWKRFEADYKAGKKDEYNREKDRITEKLIAMTEKRIIPGLSKMIVMKEAATPLTNERFTGNTSGAIYGFDQSVDNSFMSRLQNRTPVKRLYLAGAWSNPGGGYLGALLGGKNAFRALYEDLS